MTKLPDEVPPLTKLDDSGDLIPMDQWIKAVRSGAFIDYDGFGDLATADGVSNFRTRPSDALARKFRYPAWATHVLWYNR